MEALPPDDIQLKQIIKLLCTTNIRTPLTMERVKIWLKQFQTKEEQTLALLLLRHLIYRTTSQIESSLRQALKNAVHHFVPVDEEKIEEYDWQEILCSKNPQFTFYIGPPAHDYTRPGKSGEIIARLMHINFGVEKSKLYYPGDITKLEDDEYFLLVDDGSYTGEQIITIVNQYGNLLKTTNRIGIVLSITHEEAVNKLRNECPNIALFYGELLPKKEDFKYTCQNWIDKKLWPHTGVDPYQLYTDIVNEKGNFKESRPYGFGGLGLMVAYEHGVPDNTLQLLWDRSHTWQPLFER